MCIGIIPYINMRGVIKLFNVLKMSNFFQALLFQECGKSCNMIIIFQSWQIITLTRQAYRKRVGKAPRLVTLGALHDDALRRHMPTYPSGSSKYPFLFCFPLNSITIDIRLLLAYVVSHPQFQSNTC